MVNKTLAPEIEAEPNVNPEGVALTDGDERVSPLSSKLEKSMENCLVSPGCLTSISGAVTLDGSLCDITNFLLV